MFLTKGAWFAIRDYVVREIGEQFGNIGVIWCEWNQFTWGDVNIGAAVEFYPKVVGDYNRGFLVTVLVRGSYWHDAIEGIHHFRFRWVYAGTSTF
jgi:hypothetical protein